MSKFRYYPYSAIPLNFSINIKNLLLPYFRRNDFQKLACGVASNESTPRLNMGLPKQFNNKNDENYVNDPSAPLNTPTTMSQSDQRKTLKVRKVKSEVKYNEPPVKEANKKNKESKSDHEFSNENDVSCNLTGFSKVIYDIICSYDLGSKLRLELSKYS